jgi:capsular polysaccharide transport system permease protein
MTSPTSPEGLLPPPVRARVARRRFASLRTIMALILREMGTTYGRSPGGYLWAVLEPAGGIALMTWVFALVFRNPGIGISFPLFYASGMIPFIMFNDVSGKVAHSLLFSKPLLAYPSVTFVDAILARFLLNMMTQIMVAYIIFTGILLVFETRVIIDVPTIGLGLGMSGVLALGVGTLNCYLITAFPVWQRVWSIAMRPMFILSCVMFLYGSIPQPYRDWLWYNPVVHVVGMTRSGFYASYDASYVSVPYVLGFSAVCLVLGLVLLRRYHRDILQQ